MEEIKIKRIPRMSVAKKRRLRKHKKKTGPRLTNGGAGGRPSALTDGVFGKLRIALLKGKTYEQFAEENKIPIATVWNWHYENYKGFAEKADSWKRDRKVALASKNLDEFLTMGVEYRETRYSKNGEEIERTGKDPGLSRIKADMTKFTLERLDKPNYSPRTENTGPDGQPLFPENEEREQAKRAVHEFLDQDHP